MSFQFKPTYKHGEHQYAPRISDAEWQKHEKQIKAWHESKLGKRGILEELAKQDFRPSMGQLVPQMKKWGLEVYQRRNRDGDKHESRNSPRAKQHDSPRGNSKIGRNEVRPPNQPLLLQNMVLNSLSERAETQSANVTSDTTSIYSSGRSSGTRYSFSSASSVMQDDTFSRQPASTGHGYLPTSSIRPDIDPLQVLPSVPEQPFDNRDMTIPEQAARHQFKFALVQLSQARVDSSPLANRSNNATTLRDPMYWLPEYLPKGHTQPMDVEMIVAVADFLYASRQYELAFDHYFFVVQRVTAGVLHNAAWRFKMVCNCARSYVTRQQAMATRGLLDQLLSSLEGFRPLKERPTLCEQSGEAAIIHLFLAELDDVKSVTGSSLHADKAAIIIANFLHPSSFVSKFEEPFRENLAMTTRLWKISPSTFRGHTFCERHKTTLSFLEEVSERITSRLLKWCYHSLKTNEHKIDHLFNIPADQIKDERLLSTLIYVLLQAWVTCPMRKECSAQTSSEDIKTLFGTRPLHLISEFDALSTTAELILTLVPWRRQLCFDYLRGSASISRVLIETMDRIFQLRPETVSKRFADLYMRSMAYTWIDRQSSPSMSVNELHSFFILPLVVSGHIKTYLSEGALLPIQTDQHSTEESGPRHVQFTGGEADPPPLQMPPDSLRETLAKSLDGSSNSSFRNFKVSGLPVRLKNGSTVKSGSMKSLRSRSSNEMSVDSPLSHETRSNSQLSKKGSRSDAMDDSLAAHQEPYRSAMSSKGSKSPQAERIEIPRRRQTRYPSPTRSSMSAQHSFLPQTIPTRISDLFPPFLSGRGAQTKDTHNVVPTDQSYRRVGDTSPSLEVAPARRETPSQQRTSQPAVREVRPQDGKQVRERRGGGGSAYVSSDRQRWGRWI